MKTFLNPAVILAFGIAVHCCVLNSLAQKHGLHLPGALDAGAAYLFSVGGTLLTTFTNPVPASNDVFGSQIGAVGNDRVLIGAPGIR